MSRSKGNADNMVRVIIRIATGAGAAVIALAFVFSQARPPVAEVSMRGQPLATPAQEARRVQLGMPTGPQPAPLPPGGASAEPYLYGPPHGSVIGESAARVKASTLALGPISRQEVRLLSYQDVSAFAGSVILTIHPDRLFYFVVTGATWRPSDRSNGDIVCPSYITIVDAETSATRGVLCGDAAWPTRLPVQFSR